MSMSSYQSVGKRLVKCFCGCREMTIKEVQKIYQFNIQETLINREALALLKTFLEQNRRGDKSIPHQYVEVYEQCAKYMKPRQPSLTLDELKKLKNLGLPFHLESELRTQIQTGDCDKIIRCLKRIQGEMRDNIELSAEYEDYKNAIHKKLHQ